MMHLAACTKDGEVDKPGYARVAFDFEKHNGETLDGFLAATITLHFPYPVCDWGVIERFEVYEHASGREKGPLIKWTCARTVVNQINPLVVSIRGGLGRVW